MSKVVSHLTCFVVDFVDAHNCHRYIFLICLVRIITLILHCLGVDAMHPAPGSDGRPSFTAVVGNVDSDTAKYVATIDVQASREEIVLSMQRMMKVSFIRILPGYKLNSIHDVLLLSIIRKSWVSISITAALLRRRPTLLRSESYCTAVRLYCPIPSVVCPDPWV